MNLIARARRPSFNDIPGSEWRSLVILFDLNVMTITIEIPDDLPVPTQREPFQLEWFNGELMLPESMDMESDSDFLLKDYNYIVASTLLDAYIRQYITKG